MRFVTSGSSGVPKAFHLNGKQLYERAQLRAKHKGKEYANLESLFVMLRPGSSAYASHKEHCESNGIAFYSNLTHTPEQLIEAKPQGIVGAPIDLLACLAVFSGKLKFDYALATGSYLAPKVAKALRIGLLTTGGKGYVTYGASEVGTISRATFYQAETLPGCVGMVCEGNEVKVMEGRVLIKTPVMISEYEDPKLTAAHFFRGWFVPGDRGHFTNDGFLVLGTRGTKTIFTQSRAGAELVGAGDGAHG